MQDKAAMPEPVARAEVGRYCSWPTQASSYLTGCLEILAIRERYLARARLRGRVAEGRADRGAAPSSTTRSRRSGALPLGLAERAVRRRCRDRQVARAASR